MRFVTDILAKANLVVDGSVTLNTTANASVDTDKFLVQDGTVVKYRTGAQILSDIGAQGALTLTTTGTSGPATLVGNTLNIPQYQAVLTNPVTGTGTINYLPKWTGSTSLGDSIASESGTSFIVSTSGETKVNIRSASGSGNALFFTESSVADRYLIGSPAGSGDLVFRSNSFSFATGTERMRLSSSGNLGLGTASPQYSLDSTGVINSTGFGTFLGFSTPPGRTYNYVTSFGSGTTINYPGTGTLGFQYNYFANNEFYTTAGGTSNLLIVGFRNQNYIRSTVSTVPFQMVGFNNRFDMHDANDLSTLGILNGVNSGFLREATASSLGGITTAYQFTTTTRLRSGFYTTTRWGNENLQVADTTASQASSITDYDFLLNTTNVGSSSGGPGTITNFYLLRHITNIGATGTITNRWGLYLTDSSFKSYHAGNFLIGTSTDAGYKLDVATGNDNAIRIINSTGSNNNGLALAVGSGTPWIDFWGSRLDIKYNTSPGSWNGGANTFITILSGGNVGIGTTSPATLLHLQQSSGPTIRLVRTSNRFDITGDNDFLELNARDASTYMIFKTVDTERIRITSGGSVGIGTSSPQAKLQVTNSTSDGIIVSTTANVEPFLAFWRNSASNGVGVLRLIDGGNLYFDNGATGAAQSTKMQLAATGAVRLNSYGSGTFTGTPTYNLAVDASGNIIETAGGVVDGSGTTNYVSKWSDPNTLTNSIIYDNGTNVGIGTTSPNTILEAYQSVNSDAVIRITNPNSGTNAAAQFFAHNGTNATQFFHTGINYSTGGSQVVNYANLGGIYNASTGIALSAAGASGIILFGTGSSQTERMRITSGGNVGIGTSSPSSLLTVGGNPPTSGTISAVTSAQGVSLALSDNINSSLYVRNANGGAIIGTDGGNPIRFASGGNVAADEKARINPTGNFLIGTTSDVGYKLNVNGNIASNTGTSEAQVFVSNSTSSIYLFNSYAGNTFGIYDGTAGQHRMYYDRGSNFWAFYTGASERMRITSGGGVVIGGTVASNVGLTIYGSNAATIYQTPNTGTGAGNGFYVGHTGDISYIWNYNNYPTVFATNNTERMRITSGGNVGIGTQTPSASDWNANSRLLHIYQNTTDGSILKLESSNTSGILAVGNDQFQIGTSTNDPVRFYTNSAERITVTSGGLVGVGLANPQAPLHINGVCGVGSSGSLSLAAPATGGGCPSYIIMGNNDSGGTAGPNVIIAANRQLSFGVGNSFSSNSGGTFTSYMEIYSNGNVGIGTAADSGFKLDVNGTGIVRGKFNVSANISDYTATFVNTNSSSYGIYIQAGGTYPAIDVYNYNATSLLASLKGNGQLRLAQYTSTSSFPGTAAGFIGFDSSGNLITVASAGGVSGSGTTNYVARWTASTTLGIGVLYDNGTNVGIGTTSPSYTLQVGKQTAGDNTDYAIAVSRHGTGASPGTWTGNPAITIQDQTDGGPASVDVNGLFNISLGRFDYTDTNAANATLLSFTYDGQLGPMRVDGKGNTWIGYDRGAAPINSGAFNLLVRNGISVGSSYQSTTPPSDGAIIQGNVLIGTTTNSGYKLDVNGTGIFRNELTIEYTNAIQTLRGGSGYSLIRAYGNSNTVEIQIDAHSSNSGAGTIGNYTNSDLYFKTNNTNKMVIKAGGDVGIGTTNPSSLLDVRGRQFVGGGTSTYVPTSGTSIIARESLDTFLGIHSAGYGAMVIGWDQSEDRGVIAVDSSQDIAFITDMATVNGADNLSGKTPKMIIKGGGDVGIGSTSPDGRLYVERTATWSSGNLFGTNTVQYITYGSGASVGTVAISAVGAFQQVYFSGSATIGNGGRHGAIDSILTIGNTSSGTITVSQSSTLRAMSSISAATYFNPGSSTTITHLAGIRVLPDINTGAGAVTVNNKYGILIGDASGGSGSITYTTRWGIYQEGASDNNYFAAKVLIGTTTATSDALYVNGTAYINNNMTVNGTVTELSSANYKRNISTLENTLEKVDKMRAVSYNRVGGIKKEIGLIAEEVEQVYPEFVEYDNNGRPMGLNYARLTAVLLQSIKELNGRINELENRN